ncbi:MAG: hypothetical protein A2V67_04105 [Deltaproteobacteria bacterium RBG_13_61_14]|nr:MAG: hypothetical protein A2V67_04105 [Deltaproteobacteria bacterium RBG_13_61_14]
MSDPPRAVPRFNYEEQLLLELDFLRRDLRLALHPRGEDLSKSKGITPQNLKFAQLLALICSQESALLKRFSSMKARLVDHTPLWDIWRVVVSLHP